MSWSVESDQHHQCFPPRVFASTGLEIFQKKKAGVGGYGGLEVEGEKIKPQRQTVQRKEPRPGL